MKLGLSRYWRETYAICLERFDGTRNITLYWRGTFDTAGEPRVTPDAEYAQTFVSRAHANRYAGKYRKLWYCKAMRIDHLLPKDPLPPWLEDVIDTYLARLEAQRAANMRG